MCNVCDGKGIVKVCYHDGSPTDYAVCLCPAARWYRTDRNANKHTGYFGWQVWASREQIDPAAVAMLEDILDPTELTAAGFSAPGAAQGVDDAALIALGQRKGKL